MVDYRYKWVRISYAGEPDKRNMELRKNEGWEPVPDSEYPDNPDTQTQDGVRFTPHILGFSRPGEQYGLVLMRMPEERLAQRTEYYAKLSTVTLTSAQDYWLHDNAYAPMRKFVDDPATYNAIGGRDGKSQLVADLEEYYSPENMAAYPERQVEWDAAAPGDDKQDSGAV